MAKDDEYDEALMDLCNLSSSSNSTVSELEAKAAMYRMIEESKSIEVEAPPSQEVTLEFDEDASVEGSEVNLLILRNEDGTEEVEVEIDQSEIDSLNRMVEDEDIEEVEVNPSMITLDVTYRSKLDSSLVTPKKFCKLHQDGDWIYGLVMVPLSSNVWHVMSVNAFYARYQVLNEFSKGQS